MSQTATAAPNAVDSAPKPKKGRAKIMIFLLLLFSAVGAVGFAWWYFVAQYRAETDNAYVAGNVVQVTPQTSGTVVAVLVNNTDFVEKGQTLARLDETDAQIALQAAQATLADAVRSVRNLYATTDQSTAGLQQSRSELKQAKFQADQAQAQRQSAQDEYNRIAKLRAQNFISAESLTQAQSTLDAAEAALSAANSAVGSAQAAVVKAQAQRAGAAGQTDDLALEDQPKVQAAAAQVRQAFLAVARSRIVAPVAGHVAQRAMQVGERVAPGSALMAIVPPEQMWVDANFKETQLAHVRLGQSVTLISDLYGKDVVYHGKVAGFAAGTGSAFALLPAQNASGNWIKIVQRVPVRVELDNNDLQAHPLRIGLSMQAEIDTHDFSGQMEVTQSGLDKATLSSTDVYTQQAAKADALIEQIIADNSGTHAVRVSRADHATKQVTP